VAPREAAQRKLLGPPQTHGGTARDNIQKEKESTVLTVTRRQSGRALPAKNQRIRVEKKTIRIERIRICSLDAINRINRNVGMARDNTATPRLLTKRQQRSGLLPATTSACENQD
jgi:hypothetical protein